MNNDFKWRIPSGEFLEDILYECFKDEQVESAVHSWIVDTCDPRVESCFSSDDWKAICDEIPPLAESDPLLVQSMRRFMSVSEVYNIFLLFTRKSLILPKECSCKPRPSFGTLYTKPHFLAKTNHLTWRNIKVQAGSIS